MTPKEKAEELINKFYVSNLENTLYGLYKKQAKQCALIVVNEIIKEFGTYYKIQYDNKYTSYWESVKLEIEKL